MVALPRRQRLILPIAPVAAGLVWIVLAILFAALSPDALDRLSDLSGASSVAGVAKPPLGFTARLVLILVAGGGVALATWFALSLAIGDRALSLRMPGRDELSPLRKRADAHPDAPPREPLFAARELGTPFLEVTAPQTPERALPKNLDRPLAAFDPAAIPETPVAPVAPVRPLAKLPSKAVPQERLETFELTPMVRTAPTAPTPEPIVAPTTVDTIAALLDRLEQGAARRRAAA